MSITTHRPKALFFDVFGTLVDWRNTVSNHLMNRCAQALNDNNSFAAATRSKAERLPWPEFAEEWRASYGKFTASYEPGRSTFKTIDEHHRDSLNELIKQHGVDGLWTETEVADISRIWHFLDAWPDSCQGLITLKSMGFKTSTLSNGNASLLNDLCEYASLSFTVTTSAAEFGAYKPHPSVYLGACKKLGFEPSECCLVAAHLGDLQAARDVGLRTIYVERPSEESWSVDKAQIAKDDGWVDLWIEQGAAERGLMEVVRAFQVN